MHCKIHISFHKVPEYLGTAESFVHITILAQLIGSIYHTMQPIRILDVIVCWATINHDLPEEICIANLEAISNA